MHQQIATATTLKPHKKSTPSGNFSVGFRPPQPRDDSHVLCGFLAGIIATVAVLMATAQVAT